MSRLLLGILAVFVLLASIDALPLDDSDGVAESHEHWEHIVRRRSAYSMFEPQETDETSHIVDVQAYYRQVFDQGWDVVTADLGASRPSYDELTDEQEMQRLFKLLKKVVAQGELSDKDKASIQEETSHLLEVSVDSKPIPGRYLVMLQDAADDYVLDRTVEVLAKANKDSNQRIRASDFHTLKNVGKGFVATLNKKTVALVSGNMFTMNITHTQCLHTFMTCLVCMRRSTR